MLHTSSPAETPAHFSPYHRKLVQGAFARAAQFGYRIESLRIDERGVRGKRPLTVLKTRNVLGILIPPLVEPGPLQEPVWQEFALIVVDNAANATAYHIQGGEYEERTQLVFLEGSPNEHQSDFAMRGDTDRDMNWFWFTNFEDHNDTYFLDNIWIDTTGVNLANPIPEPSTYALLAGIAVLAGALLRRRMRG